MCSLLKEAADEIPIAPWSLETVSELGGSSAMVPISTATGAVYDEGIANGYGKDNITGIVQLYSDEE